MTKEREKISALTAAALALCAAVSCAIPPPPAPTDARAEANGLHEVTVSWTAAGEETSHEVTLAEAGSGADAEPPVVLKTGETAVTAGGLKADTEYTVRIVALRAKGNESLRSEPCEATVRTDAPAVPAVTGLAAVAAGDARIDVTWDALTVCANADGTPAAVTYALHVSDAADGRYAVLAEGLTEPAYAHGGLTERTAVHYAVRAVLHVDGKTFESPDSAAVSATTDAAPRAEDPAPSQTPPAGKTENAAGNPRSGAGSPASPPPAPKQGYAGTDVAYEDGWVCECGAWFPDQFAAENHVRTIRDDAMQKVASGEITGDEWQTIMDAHSGFKSVLWDRPTMW
ncbi:MAG: fibronectin type III domain-containing protein [Clostridiales Family XIII bacterium]|jgi:hypothetical protein|nr:fibronectin type III domain-containing protein [Clostridiales Family XIII bacterium]